MIARFMIQIGLSSLGIWFMMAGIYINIKPSDKNYVFITKATKVLLTFGLYMTLVGGVMYGVFESR